MRFVFIAVLAALFVVPVGTTAQSPADPPKSDAKPEADEGQGQDGQGDEERQSISALKYLANKQDSDGSWGNTAITGFVLLAFMSNGHVPNQGDLRQGRRGRAYGTCSPGAR